MEMQLGLLADSAHIDANGKLYILGEFRYVMARDVPTLQQATMIARLVADKVELKSLAAKLQVEIVDQDGNSVMPRSPDMPIQFSEIGPASRGKIEAVVIVQFNGLPCPALGDFRIHLFVDGRAVGTGIPYHVMQAPSPQGQQ